MIKAYTIPEEIYILGGWYPFVIKYDIIKGNNNKIIKIPERINALVFSIKNFVNKKTLNTVTIKKVFSP